MHSIVLMFQSTPKKVAIATTDSSIVDPLTRIQEIDYELDHGHNYYKCCLWVILILLCAALIFNLGNMILYPEIGTMVAIIITIFNCYSYSLGLRAPKERSIEKNELFRNLIIWFTVLQYVAIAIVLVIDSLNYNNTRQSEERDAFSLIGYFVAFLLQIGVNTMLYITATKITLLLKERRQLITHSSLDVVTE